VSIDDNVQPDSETDDHPFQRFVRIGAMIPKLAFVQKQEPSKSEAECRKILTELVGRALALMLEPVADGCGIGPSALAGEVVRQLILRARETGDMDRQVQLADGYLAGNTDELSPEAAAMRKRRMH
jgi:hypothetical protein